MILQMHWQSPLVQLGLALYMLGLIVNGFAAADCAVAGSAAATPEPACTAHILTAGGLCCCICGGGAQSWDTC
jgi:hypothetical protein